MREIIVSKNEAGQRFDKFLLKYLNKASSGFIYKMLRKKNIVLNDKKAAGSEKISEGDSVKLYLSEETIISFIDSSYKKIDSKKVNNKVNRIAMPEIVYEDENILLMNKPVGVLSQKSKPEDVSINDIAINYLLDEGKITKEELHTFKPSICNRLDRNTSGLIVFGKSLMGLQVMSELFKDRTLNKYYLALVSGKVENSTKIDGYLMKDASLNKVSVSKEENGGDYIQTSYEPLQYFENMTLLKVHLITGKTHQIRAHLASINHPIVGDMKYGNDSINKEAYKNHKIGSQMLHSYCLEFPNMDNGLSYLSGKTFYASLPKRWPIKIKNSLS